jgi:hypothetical protein
MTGREYIQEVFRELRQSAARDSRHRSEIFMMAALDVLRELDSPLKEETLVRLVILEATEEDECFGRKARFA